MSVLVYTLGIITALAGMALTHTGVTFMGYCLSTVGALMLITKEKEKTNER